MSEHLQRRVDPSNDQRNFTSMDDHDLAQQDDHDLAQNSASCLLIVKEYYEIIRLKQVLKAAGITQVHVVT